MSRPVPHRATSTTRRRVLAGLAALATIASSVSAVTLLERPSSAASLSFAEPFSGTLLSDPSNWRLSALAGSASPCLSAATTSQTLAAGSIGPCATTDAAGSGVLRLTNTSANQAGSLQYVNPLSTSAGLDITFSLAQWGGSGADGLSFYLKDGTNTNYAVGFNGGALGYTGYGGNAAPPANGIPGALLGIGFDRFGNFALPDLALGAGCADKGPGLRSSSIIVRSGDTSDAKDGSRGFCYLGGTASSGVSYSGGDRSAAKRAVRIVLDPSTNATPKVKIYMSGSDQVLPNTPTVEVDQPAEYKNASTFKFGFSAATGGSTDNHEVWGLGITQAPQWCTVPYLAQGASTTVGGVTVTATANQAEDAGALSYPDFYFHRSDLAKVQTIWSFSATLINVRLTTAFHADGTPNRERYTFTGKDSSGNTVLSEYIEYENATKTYTATAALSTLQADFTPSVGVYGSLVKLEIGVPGTSCASKTDSTVTYTGDIFAIAGSNSLNPGATLSPAECTGAITYSLDADPTGGSTVPFPVASPQDTTGWLPGAYVITASYAGDAACNPSTGTATVTVYTDGAAWGGGWFSVSGGKHSFGFVVQQFDRNKNIPAYTKGQVAWQSPMWRFKGTLNVAGSNAAKTQGTSSGTGTLWYWQKSGATGTGSWIQATTGAANVTIGYTATTPSTKKKSGSPGSFGISFTGTTVAGVPTLPSIGLTDLNSGNIKVA